MKRSGTRLGQNFLVDAPACLRIAEALGDVSERTVVEVGPGHGAITDHLAARSRFLHCIEFDPALARELQFRFRDRADVKVHAADILTTDLAALRDPASDPDPDSGSVDVVGNLPYYITSDILLHLFAAARAGVVRRAVLMVQQEVAERIAATPGHSAYGALSALTQMHGDVTQLFNLPPAAFSPPPEVNSTVLRFDTKLRFAELGVPFEGFNRFLRAGFAQKRKTLVNNLKVAGYPPAQIGAAWPPEVPAQARAEAVPLPALASLYRSLGVAESAD